MTEIQILNRAIRVTADGLGYEADSRHVELLASSMSMTAANSVKTPGVKDPVPDNTIAKGNEKPNTATNLGNHSVPSSSESTTGKSMCCAITTGHDPDPDDMDVD